MCTCVLLPHLHYWPWQCHNRPYLGAQIPISDQMRGLARSLQATGQFQIGNDFEEWSGHKVEAKKFLQVVSQVCVIR